MKKFLKGVLALVIIAVLAGFIFYQDVPFLKRLIRPNQTPETEVENSNISSAENETLDVNGMVVHPEELTTRLDVTGELIPNEYVELKSEISGRLDGIYFEEGEYVQKGQLLAKINVDELLAQREKLRYTKQLRETMELRQRQLLEREAISQEEYDQALTELQTSSADINLLETQIEKSEVKAPFSGIIGLRQVSLGAYVTPASTLAPLYSISPAKLEFAIPGKYSNQVKLGSHVNFTVESSEKQFTGRVYVIEPRLDPNTRTITLRALCPNPNGVLLPGQFTRVELIMGRKSNALLVPTQAVIPELGGHKLYVYKDGTAKSIEVITGTRTDTRLEIVDGIEPGDTVITTGILHLMPGMKINVKIQSS